jgi:hypothetical protein
VSGRPGQWDLGRIHASASVARESRSPRAAKDGTPST